MAAHVRQADGVSLRKLMARDLERIEEEFQSEYGAGTAQWFGFWNTNGLRARLEQDQHIGTPNWALVVTLGADIVGKVDWFSNTVWGRANTSACWEIAVGIFAAYRGRGIGTTAVENIAEQRALEKLGFSREGVVRQAQWRSGQWHDQVLYSLLRPEWEAAR